VSNSIHYVSLKRDSEETGGNAWICVREHSVICVSNSIHYVSLKRDSEETGGNAWICVREHSVICVSNSIHYVSLKRDSFQKKFASCSFDVNVCICDWIKKAVRR